MNENNLENKFLYRFVNVAYIGGLILFGLIVFAIGWSSKPEKIVDNQKSLITCNNGKKYSLEAAKINVWSGEKQLDSYDDKDARKVCAYAITGDYIDKYETPSYMNYQLVLSHKTAGSWGSAVMWWVFGLFGIYAILNIIKETLLYIIFNKKLSWKWLQNLNEFLK